METMTGRERIMTALRNKQPDRVPATPDISIMIPCRLTGKPFWEIEENADPSFTNAYINAARYFGIDGWLFNGTLEYKQSSDIRYERKVIRKEMDKWVVRNTFHTPDGDLTSVSVHPRDNPGSDIEKLVKDFKEDFKKVKHLYSGVVSCDDTVYKQQKKDIGETGMICCFIDPPGLQNYCYLMGLEGLTYAYYDYPELFEELVEMHEKMSMQKIRDAGMNGGFVLSTGDQCGRDTPFENIFEMVKVAKEFGNYPLDMDRIACEIGKFERGG